MATADQSAASVVKVLVQDWIEHYGAPLRLHSDQVVVVLKRKWRLASATTMASRSQGRRRTIYREMGNVSVLIGR